MEKIILSVEHLNKLFKSGDQSVTILHDISFAIEEGSACAIRRSFRQRQDDVDRNMRRP